MNKKQAALAAFLSLGAFILAFLISGRFWFRLDLTKNNAYTISEVSRNIYREIPDQVTITYFISDKLKQAHPLPGEIADFLREYAAHSRGRIRFLEKDPAKAGLSGVVEDMGIVPQQIQIVEQNESTSASVYTGILIEYLDRETVIPVVFSLDTLEYDLSSRVRSLVRNTGRELGVIVADGHKQWDYEYSLLDRELLLAGFRVRLIRTGEEIPAALPALFVFGGAEDLSESDLYIIDRYIAGGGRVLFAADGIFVDTLGSLEVRAVRDGGLLAMLANYGVVVRRALALDNSALSFSFQTQNAQGTAVRSVRYPEWIGVLEQNGNAGHALTSRFNGLDLYWASPLELVPPAGVTADILFTSSGGAWLQTEQFITNPERLSEFENERNKTSGTKILGAALSGVFPAWRYAQTAEIGNAASPEGLAGVPPERKPSRLIVVGDTDFAGRLMQASQGETRNLAFLLMAAEWLSSDDDLIAIRGREASGGRLDRISDPEKRNRVMVFSLFVNIALVPLGVIFAGFFLIRKRKNKTAKDTRAKK